LLSSARITQILHDYWNNLDATQRAPYDAAAAQDQNRLAPNTQIPALPNASVNLAAPIPGPPASQAPPPPGPVQIVTLDPQAAQQLQNIDTGIEQILIFIRGLHGAIGQVDPSHDAGEQQDSDEDSNEGSNQPNPNPDQGPNRDPDKDSDGDDDGSEPGDAPGDGVGRAHTPPADQPPRPEGPASQSPTLHFPSRIVAHEVQRDVNKAWFKQSVVGQKYKVTADDEGDQEDIGGDWVGVQVLGTGGQGKVSLWVRHDRNGRIVDVSTQEICAVKLLANVLLL